MDPLQDRAHDLGRLLSQTVEYHALRRANRQLADERELNEQLNRLAQAQRKILGYLDRGEDSPEELRSEYELLLAGAQGHPAYQALVAAQENFDRLMRRVNEAIVEGMEAGEKSRIILPT
ncbi:MAG: YlbF family regulator [Gemmatimonadetes bacterium]|nr:YlbF family regulator [Gemmatimonadota bacterium]